jgi:hypothetical protein
MKIVSNKEFIRNSLPVNACLWKLLHGDPAPSMVPLDRLIILGYIHILFLQYNNNPSTLVKIRRLTMKSTRNSVIYTLFTILALGFLLSAAPARAETTQCTAITSLPATISTQGIHCLTGNLGTNLATGNAIEITVNNVTIDLNGYKIGNLAAGADTTANGIYANQKKNITIKNGIIRGFLLGIFLDDTSSFTASSGHLIEDIRADGNTHMGILVEGTGNVVRNNQVVSTGGSTGEIAAWGINTAGPGARVINNDVTGTAAQSNGTSAGIAVAAGNNSVVEDNRVSDTSSPSGTSIGIYILSPSSNVMVVDNRKRQHRQVPRQHHRRGDNGLLRRHAHWDQQLTGFSVSYAEAVTLWKAGILTFIPYWRSSPSGFC